MKNYKIHFIRHGITKDNLDGIYSGRRDTPLCCEGIEELMKMKDEYTYPEAQFVFTSPLSRCKETAKLLYPEITPIEIEGLSEYSFGEFEGYTAEYLHQKQPLFDRWIKGEKNIKPPFGESNEEFAKRVCETMIKIADGILKTGTDNVVIITHGGVISTILSNLGIPEGSVTEWATDAGCGYTVLLSHFLWMSGQKFEVTKQLPLIPNEYENANYYDGWDYYPNDDDFDVSQYV